ncbi:MAG TPA: heavy metal translocating P-type ATPase metal-binding domain-containing protein [Ohtaekwangia sp.]|uniref:heavy metal translocating P-type ATPase n=1 Tax=Ohtaekwangia sp. TaxID=2066019 RepID=UPI002F9376B9
MVQQSATALKCYHCGQTCDEVFYIGEKSFCCYGCKTIYEILQENDLCEYYTFESAPGVQGKSLDDTYAYLDDVAIRKKVVEFDSPDFSRVRLFVPAIHCSSCIWLLEHLERLNPGIKKSEVNFIQKTVAIDFDPRTVNLSTVVSLMGKIGYAPQIILDKEEKKPAGNKTLVLKLAIAGFSFGNVMLFSFPEYLGLDHSDAALMRTFSWLNLALAVPVFFYSARDYFTAALASFRQKQINIDVPIALGLLALFLRSSYDIISATGPGYLDSFTGLVFFLLIGRWFQSKTYETLSFERDFKSYFPLAVHKCVPAGWEPVVIYDLQRGDQIRIRNMEIVPADSILLDAKAYIDYSFVTGESRPVKVLQGEIVYAGGRLIGQPVILAVEQKTSQSHLTSLWNHEAFRKVEESKYKKIIDQAARRFTWIVMGIALITAIYWYITAPSSMWLVITSVLMVACPCALALAAPFTYGSMLRVFGRHKLYLKNADVIERLATIDAVVFDKTGTITTGQTPYITFTGNLSEEETAWVKLLTSYSTHPLSSLVTKYIHAGCNAEVSGYKELPGKGIEGIIDGHIVRVGSYLFTGAEPIEHTNASYVFVSIDHAVRGHYSIATPVRKYMKAMLKRLGPKCVALLSGDNDSDLGKMEMLFPSSTQFLFNQSPHDKLAFIRNLQAQGKKVLMVGDGLNDAGALKQSDVGIAITDDTAVFTPACDGILQGDQASSLDYFIELAQTSTHILKAAFAISFLYNAIALSFAVTGHLTPLVAAILMPVSSISVVGFSSLAVRYVTSRKMNQQFFIFNTQLRALWKNIFLAKQP